MKTKFFLPLVALAFVFSACEKSIPDDDALSVKSAVGCFTTVSITKSDFDKSGTEYKGSALVKIAESITLEKVKSSNHELVFGDMPAGSITVTVKNGNVFTAYTFDTGCAKGTTHVFSGKDVSGIRYGAFVPTDVTATGSISGTVEGLQGAIVELHVQSSLKASIPGYDYVATTTTDAGGYYCFSNLLPGVYMVMVVDLDLLSQPVTVTNSSVVGNIDFMPPPVTEEMQMTMTTINLSGEVSFMIGGSGAVIIDWGDGSIETIPDLPEVFITDVGYYGGEKYSHTYTGASTSHTISVTGENVILLDFDPYYSDYNARLTSLDVSRNTALEWLDCCNNQLTSLDVSKNTSLVQIYCVDNQLQSLDVSKNFSLVILKCFENKITYLDVSKNEKLETLNCYKNQLTSLVVGAKNRELNLLLFSDNQLSTTAINTVFQSLPSDPIWSYKLLTVGNNPGTGFCDRSIAVNKGWDVLDIW